MQSQWFANHESSNAINVTENKHDVPEESPLVNFNEYGINYNGPVPDVVT